MKNVIIVLGICLVQAFFTLNAKTISLSCPNLDKRAPDLEVILDTSNGTVSFQSPASGSGLNFTEKASFGTGLVTWTRETALFRQIFSVNRTTLELQRKSYSIQTGETYNEKTDCITLKKNKAAKF